jgi:hypothetical protein
MNATKKTAAIVGLLIFATISNQAGVDCPISEKRAYRCGDSREE